MIQAVVALAAVVFVAVNLIADLLYPVLDPRVSLLQPNRPAVPSPAADPAPL